MNILWGNKVLTGQTARHQVFIYYHLNCLNLRLVFASEKGKNGKNKPSRPQIMAIWQAAQNYHTTPFFHLGEFVLYQNPRDWLDCLQDNQVMCHD